MKFTPTVTTAAVAVWGLLPPQAAAQDASAGAMTPSFQSGPSNGSSYAGGLTINSAANLFFATGATYHPFGGGDNTAAPAPESSCFVIAMTENTLQVTNEAIFGHDTVPGACSGIINEQTSTNSGTAVVAGFAEEGGFLSPEDANGNYIGGGGPHGYLLGVDANVNLVRATAVLPNSVTYPVAVESIGDSYFLASMTSSDSSLSGNQPQDGDAMPDYTAGGILRFGRDYSMTIQRFDIQDGNYQDAWTKEYVAAAADSSPSVYIGGILSEGDRLYVVGSTRGSGNAFGQGDGSDDGFITELDQNTGEIVTSQTSGGPRVMRIGSEDGLDDIVTNICRDDTNGQPNGDFFFVVGATSANDGAVSPTIYKISTATLQPEWTSTLNTVPGELGSLAYATACRVRGDDIFVAGQTRLGTMMEGATGAYGGDDVFSAKLDKNSGSVTWVQQVGSAANDEIAQGSGLALTSSGDAVLYGHTKGSLFRSKDQSDEFTDLFAVTLSGQDGSHQAPIDLPLSGSMPGSGAGIESMTNDDTETEITTGVKANTAVSSATPNILFDESQLGAQIEGPIYAGGLTYSPDTNKIYFTGALYNDGTTTFAASDCFLGELNLSDSKTTLVPLGATNVPEACSAVTTTGGSNPKAFVAGSTELGGLNTALADPATADSIKQFGSVLEVLLGGTLNGDSLVGGYLIGDETVTYPVAMVSEEGNDNLYVASLASSDGSTTADNAIIEREEYPDLTSGGLRRFGFRYYLRFTKLNIESATVSEETFATDDSSSVYTSGIAIVGDYVVVVGSTRGSGGAFGTKEGSDMDGFVVRLGNTLGDSFGQSIVGNARVDSSNSQDDWITQVCSDPNDSNDFYVVGATMGLAGGTGAIPAATGSVSPFIAKMSVNSLEVEWWTQLEAVYPGSDSAAEATAYGCVVDDEQVYVAGVVNDGASMMSPDNGAQASMGMNDLFVSKVAASSGEVDWVRQFGTSKNDSMGRGGSVALDGSGNVVLLGQTEGSLFPSAATETERRELQSLGVSDLVLLSVSPTGAFRSPVVEANEPADAVPVPVGPAPTEPAPTEPVPAPTEPVPAPTEPVPAPTEPVPAPTAPAPTKPSPSAASEEPLKIFAIIPVVVGFVLLLCCFCVCCIRARKRAEDRANQRKMLSIFKYLHAFDVDDIDIRRSPAGGYHGTYLNELAHGENLAPGDEETNSGGRPNMSHASVADDYMFMSKRTLSTKDDDNDSQTGLSSRL